MHVDQWESCLLPALFWSKRGFPCARQETASKEPLCCRSHRMRVEKQPQGRREMGFGWIGSLTWLTTAPHGSRSLQGEGGREAEIAVTGRDSLKTTVKTTSWGVFLNKKVQDNWLSWNQFVFCLCKDAARVVSMRWRIGSWSFFYFFIPVFIMILEGESEPRQLFPLRVIQQ